MKQTYSELPVSTLYNEITFYSQFTLDLLNAREEVIIESPFITIKRLKMLKNVFAKLIERNDQIFIFTKDPLEQDKTMEKQSEAGISYFEELGAQVLLVKGSHHRKLAIIDQGKGFLTFAICSLVFINFLKERTDQC